MHIRALFKNTSEPDINDVGDSRGKAANPYCPTNVSNQKYGVPDESIATYGSEQPFLPPLYSWQISRNSADFLPKSSYVRDGGPAKDMPQAVALPINRNQTVKRIFQFPGKKICNNSETASYFNATESRHEMDANKENSSRQLTNNDNHKALMNAQNTGCSEPHVQEESAHSDVSPVKGTELVLYGRGGSQNTTTSTDNSTYDQNHTFPTPESIQEGSSSSQHPTVTVAVPGFNSRKRAVKDSTVTDRLRRARIAENIDHLHELLPQSVKRNKETVMEDVINYVKYLKLQAKVLSQCRLGGEATNDPFVHLEGFGHYLHNQQVLNEPLEEILGQKMETDKLAVTQLLEAKGLYIMPVSLAEGLS